MKKGILNFQKSRLLFAAISMFSLGILLYACKKENDPAPEPSPVANFTLSTTDGFSPLIVDIDCRASIGFPTVGIEECPNCGTFKFLDVTYETSTDVYTYTFLGEGEYKIKLVVYGGKDQSEVETKIQTVTVRPQILHLSTSEGVAPLKVNFSNSMPGATSSLWNFGDGGTSTEKNPVYTYNNVGEFTVSLTTSAGGQSFTSTSKIKVMSVADRINTIKGLLASPNGTKWQRENSSSLPGISTFYSDGRYEYSENGQIFSSLWEVKYEQFCNTFRGDKFSIKTGNNTILNDVQFINNRLLPTFRLVKCSLGRNVNLV